MARSVRHRLARAAFFEGYRYAVDRDLSLDEHRDVDEEFEWWWRSDDAHDVTEKALDAAERKRRVRDRADALEESEA